jgi:hypothetical protein
MALRANAKLNGIFTGAGVFFTLLAMLAGRVMSIPLNPTATWMSVAVFEIEAAPPAFRALQAMAVEEPDGLYRIVPCARSPMGYRWFEVLVDFRFGERRAMHVTAALLDALRQSAHALPGYRLVSGGAWLEVAEKQLYAEAEQHAFTGARRH